ncbi:MAG: response regulator [Eubacteriales bacterium]
MLKVIIADDEARIVRLICALIDWNALDLEIVATASDGISATQQVLLHQPDILITDIRMPGRDGLDLIKAVKSENQDLEVIIISGYAHFPYAQAAISYGVSDYLLKPINKEDLTQTLLKLKEKILTRRFSRNNVLQLMAKEQHAKTRMQNQLALDLLEKGPISLHDLDEQYGFPTPGDTVQAFCLKLDYDTISQEALQVVYDKAGAIFKSNLKNLCTTLTLNTNGQYLYGLMNFDGSRQGDIKRILRDCLNQLVTQKAMLGDIEFTITLGFATKDKLQLSIALQNSLDMVPERIVAKTEHLIDTLPSKLGLQDQSFMERYTRQIATAMDTLDKAESNQAVQALQRHLLSLKTIRGQEVLHVLNFASTAFVMRSNVQNQGELLENFKQQCDRCGSIPLLFRLLSHLQQTILDEMQSQHDNEALRPIRLAKQYIQNHYSEAITLEQISDIVGLSPTYFSTLFKKETGEGFAKYLIAIRVEQAKILLRESNLSISAICKEVGYNDVKHFNQTFEKACDIKPSVYRKLYG